MSQTLSGGHGSTRLTVISSSVSLLVNLSVSHSDSYCVIYSINQSFHLSVGQSISLSVCLSVNQSILVLCSFSLTQQMSTNALITCPNVASYASTPQAPICVTVIKVINSTVMESAVAVSCTPSLIFFARRYKQSIVYQIRHFSFHNFRIVAALPESLFTQ